MEEMAAEKEKLAAEKAENAKMLEELRALKAQLEGQKPEGESPPEEKSDEEKAEETPAEETKV